MANPIRPGGDGTRTDYRRQLGWALFRSLVLPILLLVFFVSAPRWLESQLHREAAKEIRESNLSAWQKKDRLVFVDRLHFEKVCANPPPLGMEEMHQRFEKTGLCGRFHRMEWGEALSILLVVSLSAAVLVMFLLDERARQFPRELILAYRVGWRIGMASSLLGIVLLVPLLAYGTFEFTSLLFSVFFPKLIILIVLGGGLALWMSVKILIRKVPLEFPQPWARQVTPEEAPELWSVVREAAGRLGTPSPDGIVVGMAPSFFVTELALRLDGGKTAGKTLFLSYPLLRHLAPDEVLAIVGHELAHFMEADTRMTREFYPLRFKIEGTMLALARAGLVARPSFEFLQLFTLCFEETIQRFSRQRELAADRTGASLTSTRTMARALVRVHVLIEALQRGGKDAVHMSRPDPFHGGLRAFIGEKLVPNESFWSHLFERRLSHPLDSHPALGVRLEGLGEAVSLDEAKAMAVEPSESAFERLFPGREGLFAPFEEQIGKDIGRLRTQAEVASADLGTEEGQALLKRQFPDVTWQRSPKIFRKLAITAGVIFALGALLAGLVSLGSKPETRENWPVFVGIFGFTGLLIFGLGWLKGRKGQLMLRSDGIRSTDWSRPLPFQDVAGLSARVVNHALMLTFQLKRKQPAIAKLTLWPFPSQRVVLALTLWDGKPGEILQTIDRYFAKRIE